MRILLRTPFQDLDRTHRGLVTRIQFARAMDNLGYGLTQPQEELLCLAYSDRGNHKEFNYVDFCKACDLPSEGTDEGEAQMNSIYVPHQASQYFNARGEIIPMAV